jgi:hypothetical protein
MKINNKSTFENFLSCSEKQIVFVPSGQSPSRKWHKYDCLSQTLLAYDNPFHSTSNPLENRSVGSYVGGVFDPLNHQIVFSPHSQAFQAKWHRYDCLSQTLQAYDNSFHSSSLQPTSGTYYGAVFDPINNQIVFVPCGQGPESSWHRYDCSSQTLQAYENPFHSTSTPTENQAVSTAYSGGVYDPIQNQIIFAPREQGPKLKLHQYDCASQTVQAYDNPFHSSALPIENRAVSTAYIGGVFDPHNNQIVFVPYGQANRTTWHTLQNYGATEISRQFASHYLFNKF